MTTTVYTEGRRESAVRFWWWPALVVGPLVALLLSAPSGSRASVAANEPAVERSHERVEALMAERAIGTASARLELVAIRKSMRPLARGLRREHPELARTLERELDDALAQVSDAGEQRFADRAEFDISYLVPLAQTLSDVRDTLESEAP